MKAPSGNKKNFFRYQLSAFGYAFSGLKYFFRSEIKSRIHLVAAILAVTLGILFGISAAEWLMITFSIGIVFVSEVINTAIELMVDQITDQKTERAGRTKDLAAGAVLLASITALIIGLLIFTPKILQLLCV
jgi:diacylglycerol kinase